jgi:chromosomal replication initiation ATPase DnaA
MQLGDSMAVSGTGKKEYLEAFVSNAANHCAVSTLNTGQRAAHDAIIGDVALKKGTTFTLMAAAGSGKTFLIGAILNTARQSGLRVVTCASSALAASLLGRSRTAHSVYKIPISIDEHSTCKAWPTSGH